VRPLVLRGIVVLSLTGVLVSAQEDQPSPVARSGW